MSAVIIVEGYYLGDTVTLNCVEGCNKSVTTDNIAQITWKKTNNSHILHFVTTLKPNQTFSNFSESRFSFQDPLTLRITDAQLSDSGNYICDLSTSTGLCKKTFPVIVSENNSTSEAQRILICTSISAVAVVVIIIIIIIVIVYWRTRPETEKPPDKIHQTSPEPPQREEPIYDNADQNYCLRFNTLYDGLPLGGTMQSQV